MIEHVKELRAKHQSRILVYAPYACRLLDSPIEVKLPGTENNPVAGVSIRGRFAVAPNDRRSPLSLNVRLDCLPLVLPSSGKDGSISERVS